MREAMANIANNQELARRIEQLVREHITASRTAAQEALERAFASALGTSTPTPTQITRAARPSKDSKRRTPTEMAVLGERFYQAVCAKPGETMTVLAAALGASPRELNRPMNLLKRSGRVRSVGARHRTRYFPMAGDASSCG